jgi:Ca-activated chloride channel family protein
MIDGFHLLRPELLWGLTACPLVALALWYRRIHQGDWTKVIDAELLPFLMPDQRGKTQRSRVWAPTLLLALVTVAAAGPSLHRVELPVIKRADALVIVLDLSASMLAADIQPSRIQRARQKVLDLLDTRQEGVTGLVVFAGDAHVVTPLTDDTRTIANLMPALSPTIMPLPGADATSAIELASDLLLTAGAQGGHILLMTDGLPGFAERRVQSALDDSGASLAILGVGTASGAPIPLPNGGFLKDNNGEIVIPALDRNQLSAFAAALGAPYEEVSLDEQDIESLTRRDVIATEGELDLDRQTDAWQDQGFWLAALVALLMLPAFRKGVVASLVFMLMVHAPPPEAADWDDLWLTPDQQGARHLAAGEASEAAAAFTDSSWRGVAEYQAGSYDQAAQNFAGENTANNLYNLGNALALEGDLRGALGAYEESLSLEPDAEDAIANRDFIQSLLDQEEQQQDQEGDQQNQEGDQSEEDSESDSQGDNTSDSSDQGEQEQGDGENSDEPDNGQSSQSESDQEQQGEQDPTMADAQDMNAEALEAATQEQMAKFDEALEEQQALEQWLRRVPDDPGGLLRRKFRYQTMQRLREGEEPDESIRW